MEDNLEMILRVAVRSSIPLQTSNTAVRVARLDSPDHGFTWAQRIPTTCSRCRLSLSLVVLTSNSMLFILRMLYIATTLFETVETTPSLYRYRLKSNVTEAQIEELHRGMQMYRADVSITEEGIPWLHDQFLRTADTIQGYGRQLYSSNVTWLLLHELAHADKQAFELNIRDPGGHLQNAAELFFKHCHLDLDLDRRAAWQDELSADLGASWVLAHKLDKSFINATHYQSAAERVGKVEGFTAGVLTTLSFELYEAYEAGKVIGDNWEAIAQSGEYRSHPPLGMRSYFLRWFAERVLKLDLPMVKSWKDALNLLFAEYVDRYPLPD
jgi:hypothetical protein